MPLTEFTWDENKRLSNLAKHGLDFEDAHWVFTDEALAAEDTRREYGEPRFILYGPLFVRIVVVVFTVRDDVMRILSMRKANQREQKNYDQKRSEADRRHDG
jgi:uncharacterized DUF497 family protein